MLNLFQHLTGQIDDLYIVHLASGMPKQVRQDGCRDFLTQIYSLKLKTYNLKRLPDYSGSLSTLSLNLTT